MQRPHLFLCFRISSQHIRSTSTSTSTTKAFVYRPILSLTIFRTLFDLLTPTAAFQFALLGVAVAIMAFSCFWIRSCNVGELVEASAFARLIVSRRRIWRLFGLVVQKQYHPTIGASFAHGILNASFIICWATASSACYEGLCYSFNQTRNVDTDL